MRRCLVVLLAAIAALTACRKAAKPAPPVLSQPIIVSDGPLGSPVPDAALEDGKRSIAVGFDGVSYLVVWSRQADLVTGVPAALLGARVSATGQLVDPEGFVISSAPGGGLSPAIAFDGTNYLVAWEDHRTGPYLNVYAARVSPEGRTLDPNGFPLAAQTAHQLHPAVAFDGASYLVVWEDRRSDPTWDVYATRVSLAGAVLDAGGFALSTASSHQTNPALAFDGQNYLAVWQDQRSDQGDIWAARVTPAGTVLDRSGFAVSTAAALQSFPAVASTGGSCIVVWQDLRNGLVPDVYAAPVSAAGAVGTATAVAVAAGAQQAPAVAFDGIDVLVAWEDGRSGTQLDVYGARLDPAGALLDPAGFLFASGTGGVSVAVASDRAGRGLVAYDALSATGDARLRARLFTDWAKLAIAKAGKGGGTVSSSPAGIDCGATCSAPFDAPTAVTLAASPDGDSVFGGWSGDCAGTGDCTVTVDAAKSAIATFLPLYPLAVTTAGAAGTVTSTPAGIDCGGACSARFAEGTAVTLAAKGTAGASVFASWSGDCTGSDACTVAVDGPKSVTATFVPAYTLALTVTGTGAGSLSVGGQACAAGSCKVDVATGTTVTVTATPDAASILKTWSGCSASTETSCTVAMSSARYVTARFEPKTLALTAVTSGNGTVSGVVGVTGLSCTTGSTAGCTGAVANPPFTTAYTTVTLRATPDATTSVFKQWYGCTPVTGDPASCTVTVSAARSVTAKFEPKSFAFTVTPTGTAAGTVTGPNGLACTTGSTAGCTVAIDNPPDSTSYAVVTLSAAPGDAAVFKAWGGGCYAVAGAPRSCTITVGGAKSVTARFEPSTFPLTASTAGSGAGTVSGVPGLSCTTGSTQGCTAPVDNLPDTIGYQTVTLRAQPVDAGSVFKSWIGCTAVAGDPAACTVMMSGARSVSAKFEPSTFALNAATTGTGAGTISGVPGLSCTTGSTDGCSALVANPPNSAAYETVTLRAQPLDAGSVFKSWAGCSAVAGDPASCTVTVSSARYVTAKFEPSTFPLAGAFSGTGAGTLTLPGGIICAKGSTGCAVQVENPANTASYATVTITAQPDASSIFKGWSGCTPVAGTPTACTVTVSGARTVWATFEPSTYPLTASLRDAGGGTVTGSGLDCGTGGTGTCTASLANGATATLTATPDSASVFAGWSGCTSAAGATCTVTMTSARTVYATFQPSAYALTVFTSGAGGGTVAGDHIACTSGSSAGCSEAVANGATVVLTAKAGASSVFTYWSGCPIASGDTCTVPMTSARTVYAYFQPSTFTLSVSFGGTGTGAVTGGDLVACTTANTAGCVVSEPYDSNVTLTASPDAGMAFTGWSGQCTGTATCTVQMTAARYVRASFSPAP